jgi:hypothetical protein
VRRAAAAVGAALLVASLALPAEATHTNLEDGNDVRGPLDLRTVVLREDRGPYAWVFRTYSRWSVRGIWDSGFFVVELETLGSPAVDYVVVVRSDGRSMVADLFRRRGGGDQVHRRRLSAWRAGGRGAGVDVPRLALRVGANRLSFFWSSTSLFTGPRCTRTCADRTPDGDTMVEQVIGGGSPTPSPTVFPTPTVSPTPSPTSSPTSSPSASPTAVAAG